MNGLETNQTKGYHGTIQPYADSILSSKKFEISSKPNEWLGYGVYFFLHYEEADWWAKGQASRLFSKKAILMAELEYKDENFLNLDLFQNARDVNRTFKQFLETLKAEGMVAPAFRSKGESRCFAIELYKSKHPEVKVIAYTFDAPGKISPKDVFIPRQLQYCVVDDSVIKSIELVS